MKNFYKLINKLILLDFEYKENNTIFEIDFKYSTELDFLIQYDYLKDISNIFPNKSLKIYVCIYSDIDILDSLDDKDEFYDEISFVKVGTDFKLILKKIDFVKSIFGEFDNTKITFFVIKNELIKFLNQDINELEDTVFKKNIKDIFILGDSRTFIKNSYFMITNINRDSLINELEEFNISIIKDTQGIIDMRNLVCNWIDGSHFLTPEYLYVDFNDKNFVVDDRIKFILYKKGINLILAFISNFTGIVDGKYKSIINGNKRIEIDYDYDIKYELIYYKNMFHLYKWIYDSSTFDKINICRNVVSILVTAKCQGSEYRTILENSDWLVRSVADNFKVFLKNNIDNYFKEKNTLIEQIRKDIWEINNQISELTKLSNSSIVSSIGLMVAGIISYSAKLNISLVKILCLIYLFYLDISSIFNLPIIISRFIQSKNNFEHKKKTYIHDYNKDNEIKLLTNNNSTNKKMFYRYMKLTVFLIVLLNFIVIGVIYSKPYIKVILKIFGL